MTTLNARVYYPLNMAGGKSISIIGYGVVGRAYHKMFPDAVIYDEPLNYWEFAGTPQPIYRGKLPPQARKSVNLCDLAIVCVPTNLKDGKLDTSIVEEVVGWLETPLILIQSALQPGTWFELHTFNPSNNIAVGVEMVGESKYHLPAKYPHPTNPGKQKFLILGGEEYVTSEIADILWEKMSPDINIHLVSAIEAEICKLMENSYNAMKVTFANVMYDICQEYGANYTKVLQACGEGWLDKMHMRVTPDKRGWGGKCLSKDVPALAELDESGFIKSIIKANEEHNAKH